MARKKTPDGDTSDEGEYEITSFAGDAVPVEIVVDHVFLPLDAEGNVPATWREAPDTVRVGRGTKLTVPADMLEMLGDKVARVA